MGSCSCMGTYKSYDWKSGINKVQDEYEEEYGRQEGYSGGPNCVNFCYGGDASKMSKTELNKYIQRRMDILNKRDGEILKIGTDGYDIITTIYKELKINNSFSKYLKGCKRPAILLKETPFEYFKQTGERFQVVESGTIAEMKNLAHTKLRSCYYITVFYIVTKSKVIECMGTVKKQAKTTRKTDEKTLVLERNIYRYFGWAPE